MKDLKKLSLIFIVVFNVSVLFGQSNLDIVKFEIHDSNKHLRFTPLEFNFSNHDFFKSEPLIDKVDIDRWPVFCKLEEKWRQKYNLPAKFRLGSVEYVDFLENK
jgi:hypothetical protein